MLMAACGMGMGDRTYGVAITYKSYIWATFRRERTRGTGALGWWERSLVFDMSMYSS